MPNKYFDLLARFWPFLLILFTVCTFFYQVFLGKVPVPGDLIVGGYYPWLDYNWGHPTGVPVKNPIASDAISFIYPMRMLAIDLLKSGQWPLWNPYLLNGTPLLANFQSAPFSPTNIFYFVFDRLTAWSLQVVVQHIFAASFIYLLLRSWKVSQISSVFAGVVYAFTGFNLLWSQWNAHALTASFIPLLLLFTDKFLAKGSLVWGAGIAFLIGLQFLSGYPQIMTYTALALFSLWVVRFRKEKSFFLRTLIIIPFVLLGVGIAALQILPGYELINLSQRAKEVIPIKWVFLDWREIILFIAPDYYGNHSTQNYWGHKNYLSTLGFVGVANLIIAFVGLSLTRVNKEAQIAALIGLFGLILAFQTPISNFLWETNFLGYQAGVSYRSLVLFCLSISLLVGFGLDKVGLGHKFSVYPFILPAFILSGFGVYTLLAINKIQISSIPLPVENLERFQVGLRNLILPAGSFVSMATIFLFARKLKLQKFAALLIISISLLEMFYFGWKFTPFVERQLIYPETPVISYLKKQEEPFRVTAYGVMPVNQGMPYKLEFPGGYDAVYSYTMAKYIGVLNSNNPEAKAQDRFGIIDRESSNLLNITNTKYILAKNNNDLGEKYGYRQVFNDRSVVVWENPDSFPRAKVFFDWEVSRDENRTLQRLLDPEYPINTKVIVDKEQKSSATGDYSIDYKKYSSQRSLLSYGSSQPGILFLSQQWYPGWEAFVDGERTKIFKANYTFQGISVPAGEHEVEFSYNPESFTTGLKISLISLITIFLLVVSLFVAKVTRRRYTLS